MLVMEWQVTQCINVTYLDEEEQQNEQLVCLFAVACAITECYIVFKKIFIDTKNSIQHL